MTDETIAGSAPAVFDAARCPDAAGAVHRLLVKYGLNSAPPDHVDALAGSVARLRKQHPPHAHALVSRERKQALACVRALLRHTEKPPRRAATTDDKRKKLVELLDSLHGIVKLAANGFNAAPVLRRLKSGEHTPDDLGALLLALTTLPPGSGSAPPPAKYLRLLRGGLMTWKACSTKSYTFNQYNDEPTMDGELSDFLRELIELAGLPVPTDNTLHTHLVKLKNL